MSFSSPCKICESIRTKAFLHFSLESEHTILSASNFTENWPGSLVLFSKKHVCDQTDLYPSELQLVWHDIVDAERSLRKVTGCDRVNFVKFGNVARHLHWHVIPRYLEEWHPELTPWEILQNKTAEPELKVVKPQQPQRGISFGLSHTPEQIFQNIKETFLAQRKRRTDGHFSTALMLRPATPNLREFAQQESLEKVIAAARASPENWQCLLMKRGYGDKMWDTFGGHADPGEFPNDTLRREISEELGWELQSSAYEVSRQWNSGVLRGFVFVARPKLESEIWMSNSPEYRANHEVAEIAYFPLSSLLEAQQVPIVAQKQIQANLWRVNHSELGSCYLASGVAKRFAAFISAEPDFLM